MNKASGVDGIPAEKFQSLKDDSIKAIHSICQHILKAQQQSEDWRRSVFISIQKKGNAKECSNYHKIGLISHASKFMLKILQARLQHYMNQELPDVQAGFRKGRETRDQITNICWIMEKAARESSRKTSASLTTQTPLIVWITTNWKLLKETGIPDHLTCLLRNLQIKKQQIEPDMEQQTGSKLGRSTLRLYIVTLLI